MASSLSSEVSATGRVLTITLANPRQRNALTLAMRGDLAAALNGAMASPEIRVVVVTGEGEHFCAGGDISSMDGLSGFAGRDRMRGAHSIVQAIVHGEKPVIAAVEGIVAGGGIGLAAACDIVVASRDARFLCSFNRIGLAPDLGAAWSLPLRMGLGRARLMMLSGRELSAAQAERAGLVELLADSGSALVEASRLAEEIAMKAPLSNAMTKSLLARVPRDLDDMLRAEADLQGLLYTSGDFIEGRDAFRERREPRFAGI